MRASLHNPRLARGFSLIELLIGMALMLVIVTAASIVYLNTRETDGAQSRVSESIETGTFALELIGRDITQAWSYPVVMPPATDIALTAPDPAPTALLLQTYPPVGWTVETTNPAYQVGIFGCDGGQYNSATGACVATTAITPYRSPPDSIVVNYFSNESVKSDIGNRKDCSGVDAGNDVLNATRKFNDTKVTTAGVTRPTTTNENWPPSFPVFVSNRYGLVPTTTEVEKRQIDTVSLACNGNGTNGVATPTNLYQPLLLGVEDLQITYGAFDIDATSSSGAVQPAPTRFYKASDVAGLTAITIDGTSYSGWSRIVAVRVCVMTRTLGTAARLGDGSTARTYLDCTDDTPQSYDSADRSIRTRSVQVMAVRNRMNQIY